MSTITNKLAAKFSEKMGPMASTSTMRPDLYLADWRRVDGHSAKLLVGWATSMTVPALEAFDNFVLSQFQGKLQLELPTIRVIPKTSVAMFIAREIRPVRSIKDASSLMRVSPTRYMEASNKSVWEVRENEEGKHLVLLQSSNLDEVLEERRKAVMRGGSPNFDKVVEAQGKPVIDVGDKVRFYHKGLLKQGTIVSQIGPSLKIRIGKTLCLADTEAVLDIVGKDPSTNEDQKERVMAYWKKLFPKEYLDKWLHGK